MERIEDFIYRIETDLKSLSIFFASTCDCEDVRDIDPEHVEICANIASRASADIRILVAKLKGNAE